MVPETPTHKASILEVKTSIQMLESAGIQVDIFWTPGHSNIQGIEYADQMAKEAAEEAKEMTVASNCHNGRCKDCSKRIWQDEMSQCMRFPTILVCATSQASDQSAHTRSLIRVFTSRLRIL